VTLLSKRLELTSRFKFSQVPSIPWEYKELKKLAGIYSWAITK